MPAPRRIKDSVYIMVPGELRVDLYKLGLRASRIADQEHKFPLFPQHLYASILTEEESDRELPLRCQKLVRRVSAIWLCIPPGLPENVIEFDSTSYQILMQNEGYLNGFRRPHWSPTRLPVHKVEEKSISGRLTVSLLSREELSDILKANVVDGLLSGLGEAMRSAG